MARPLRIQYPGAFYHVTCRGNERRKIFRDDDDRHQFLTLLSESLALYQVKLYGYVLMNNHFHLLVQTLRPNLSEFMRRFNYHHGRCGHLYQGRYTAIVVDADTYLVELSRYIHLNPVRISNVQKLEYHAQRQYLRQYRWSTLPGYINKSQGTDYVTYDLVLAMMGGRRAYQRFVREGLKQDLEDPHEHVQYQLILGDNDFAARIKRDYLENGSRREQPMYRDLLSAELDPAVILQTISEVMAITQAELTMRQRGGMARGIAAELLYRYSGLTQQQIGQLLGGIDYGAVYQLRRRMKERRTHDTALERKYHEADHKLKKMLNVEI
jgi:putative transposase